jgi:hypothetical protein
MDKLYHIIVLFVALSLMMIKVDISGKRPMWLDWIILFVVRLIGAFLFLLSLTKL